MTYNGSAAATREAMEAALKLEGFTEEEINDGYKSIIDQLLDLDPKVVMEIANSIWYKKGFEVENDFINTNKEHFYAEIRELDFNRPDARDIINQWVSEHTNELIEEIIDNIPPEAVMYLINAIYFKGTWTYEFDPEDTQLRPFYPEEGPSDDVSSMRQETALNYFQNSLLQLAELPYGDEKYSMLVLLPSNNNSCVDILAELSTEKLDSWTNGLAETNVLVQLPKFKFETFKLLNDPLTSMGMGVAFSDNADFTRINPEGNLFISRVMHKTFIDVNEEGTEAAAVTAVEISLTSAGGEPQPVYFIADRPFLFLIRENSSGSILFIGKLSQPEY
jgi:serpin B